MLDLKGHAYHTNVSHEYIYTYGLSYKVISLNQVSTCIQSFYFCHMEFMKVYVDIFGLCAHANLVSVGLKEVFCPSKSSITFFFL